jgi:RNA polymerase sigma-70 factor (ECF subfamily)
MTERPTEAPPAVDAPPATDADLVRGARGGGVAAFEALTARHFPMVYALAYARLGAREAAEDLAQEVFLLAILHLGALADPARFAAWLGRIARNEEARDHQFVHHRRRHNCRRVFRMACAVDGAR